MAIQPNLVKTIEKLQAKVQGDVLVAGDAGYDEARAAWNLNFEQHPALIVIALSAADVVQAVRFARAEGLDIAVQSTGHGTVRMADGALLIVTSKMKGIQIDVAAQTAWVEAGLKWGEVLPKTQAVGLAPLLGSSTDVGVIGYTLGGGMGWLARKYGLSADNVIYFEVVTADGRLIRVSQSENADLFWALRGGGGAFGVVTGMEIKLYPVTNVYGGNLYYPAEMAKEVISRYREWIKDVPDELTSSFLIMNYPPIPQIPEPLRGKSFVQVRGLWSGDVEKGKELLKFWREWQAPVIDAWVEMPFTAAATISNDPEDPTPGLTTSAWIREISDDVIDTLIKYVVPVNGPSPLVIAEVRHAGGAISRVDPHSAAYGNREAQHILEMIAITPTPESQHAFYPYTNAVRNALGPALTGGVYMNFLEGFDSRERVKQGFLPENYQRLTEIKAKYDPENYFSYGFNIPPAGEE